MIVTITAPNGGQSWGNATSQNLVWTLDAAVSVGAFNAWLIDGAGNWVTTVGTVAAVPGLTTYSVPWIVSAPARADYRLTVWYRPDAAVWGGWTANDESDAAFTVTGTALAFAVTAPNGGESWANGTSHNLAWTLNSAASVGAFNAWLIDGAGNWVTTVDTVAAVPGQTIYSVPWTVAAPAGAGYRLTVWYRPDPAVWGGWAANDESDTAFTVTGTALAIAVTAPNGGESWANGISQNLGWTLNSAVSVGAFNIWLIDGAGNWVTTVDTVAAVPGQTIYSVPWTVAAPAGAGYRLSVWYRPDPAVWGGWAANDESDATFAVTGPQFTIPRRSIAGMEGMYAKMWDPPKESPLTPEYIAPTNPVPEFMETVIPGFGVSEPHTVDSNLLQGVTMPTWDGVKNLDFMTIRDGDNPFATGTFPGPTIRVPRGVIFHAQTQGKGPPPHTIHWHGIEPTPMNDGVGHCSMEIGDYLYQWQPNFIGTYFYHCHRNTVQHFEFGLYGALLIEPPDAYADALTAGGYPRRTAANLATTDVAAYLASKGLDAATDFGFVAGDPVDGVGNGDPHAFTIRHDVEALWVPDDRDSIWSDMASNARAFYPQVNLRPGVDDTFYHGFFHDFNADYWFVTGVPVLGHKGDGSLATPVPIKDPALVFGTTDGTVPAALNSGVAGMQVAINAHVNDVILVRCLDAAYNCISVTFPMDVIIVAWDGRALGVPPFGRYNHAYVVPAGTAIHTSTARRYDALIRSAAPFSGHATVQFIDTHGQNIPGRPEPVLVTTKIPITIT